MKEMYRRRKLTLPDGRPAADEPEVWETVIKLGFDQDVTMGEGDDLIITSREKARELQRRDQEKKYPRKSR